MRILLVDDEPALRELLRATFEGAQVAVDEAASVPEAEARIRLPCTLKVRESSRPPSDAAPRRRWG